jgi:hypothetical protein
VRRGALFCERHAAHGRTVFSPIPAPASFPITSHHLLDFLRLPPTKPCGGDGVS